MLVPLQNARESIVRSAKNCLAKESKASQEAAGITNILIYSSWLSVQFPLNTRALCKFIQLFKIAKDVLLFTKESRATICILEILAGLLEVL